MGLFSSVIHLRSCDQSAVYDALKGCIQESGYAVGASFAPDVPPRDSRDDTLQYLISPRLGDWATIIQCHFAVYDSPWLSDLALELSASLDTYALSMMVHDDDVLYYDLARSGEIIDGYNSCPQYFEKDPLTDAQIREQRHDCSPFVPLLPAQVSLSHLEAILERGWWGAYLGNRLDEDRLVSNDEPQYTTEADRMADIGNLLQLHGGAAGYPFADWFDNAHIDWKSFVAVRCSKHQ